MSTLNIQRCPETGICSIIKQDGSKIDLMPDEATKLAATTDSEETKALLSEVDASFTMNLAEAELKEITQEVK
ncbi:MAG: hypothetical protein ISS35_10120 [Kiritimatiellae bacterium]|nr:hypothetical protein [Kiritimatiellia bacterium]